MACWGHRGTSSALLYSLGFTQPGHRERRGIRAAVCSRRRVWHLPVAMGWSHLSNSFISPDCKDFMPLPGRKDHFWVLPGAFMSFTRGEDAGGGFQVFRWKWLLLGWVGDSGDDGKGIHLAGKDGEGAVSCAVVSTHSWGRR